MKKMWNMFIILGMLIFISVALLLIIRYIEEKSCEGVTAKPVIYLYPECEMKANVQLEYNGDLTVTYPEYKDGGWNVIARPDGTLIDALTGKEYSYLFWEGEDRINYDMSEGFVVKGKDTVEFL